MKTNDAFIIVLICFTCFIPTEAVEVYEADSTGKPAWRETSEMRDRSNVPRPSPKDMAADYRRRWRIPLPVITHDRSRSSDIPRPSGADILADYRRRSKIPIPITSSKLPKSRKRFKVPLSQVERTNSGINVKMQTRRATNKGSYKKNIIDRIFFTIPFGAQFPIFFASKSKKGTNKKSKVATPGQPNRAPFRLQEWGLPINYQAINSRRYLTPYLENPAIARQQVIPTGDYHTSLGYNRRYVTPRSFITSRLLSNRNIIPYSSYRYHANRVPYQLRNFLNQSTRSRRSTESKSSTLSEQEEDVDASRKAAIYKATDRQRMDNVFSNTITRDPPQSAVDKEIENILTKLLIVI